MCAQPYFYIIQHIPSELYYVGAKWGKDADPNNFMKPGGYTTSSNGEDGVNDLINRDGLESFRIIDIILEEEIQVPFGCQTVYEYETWFLQSQNIAKDKKFINSHNNIIGCFQSNEFKIAMVKRYGYENPSQSPIIRQRVVKTNNEKYGGPTPMSDSNIRKKVVDTTLERYGVTNKMKLDSVKEQTQKSRKINAEQVGKSAYDSVSEALTGTTTYYYPSGTYYGRIPHDSPIIKELGLIHIRSEKQKTQATEQALINAADANVQKKKSEAVSKLNWYHNPETQERARLLQCPDGWKDGRGDTQVNHGKIVYNDGIKNYMLKPGETPDPSWTKGMAPQKVRYTNYTDGITWLLLKKGDAIPVGFKKAKKPK